MVDDTAKTGSATVVGVLGLLSLVARNGRSLPGLKEVLRRAALLDAERGIETDDLIVTSADPTEALDELLDDRARLTKVILDA